MLKKNIFENHTFNLSMCVVSRSILADLSHIEDERLLPVNYQINTSIMSMHNQILNYMYGENILNKNRKKKSDIITPTQNTRALFSLSHMHHTFIARLSA